MSVQMTAAHMTPAAETKPGIVIVTHEFAPFRGGAAVYSQELADAIHRAGRAVEVWAPDYAGSAAKDAFAFPVVRLRAGGSLRAADMFQFTQELMARGQRLELATVLLTSVGAHVAFMALALLGRMKCRRVFSLLHGSEVLRFQGDIFWRFGARRLFPRVAGVLTVSQFSKSLIDRSFLSSLVGEVAIAPCASSTAAMRSCPPADRSDGKIRVLTLARVHPRKGQLDTARALALLPSEMHGRIVYQVGGKGDTSYLRQVETTCRDTGIAFEHLGEINPESLAPTYQQCDIFAMASRSLPKSVEGFGIAYLEAGFHGKPVVGYRSGGASEAIVDGETGLLVNEGDLTALAAALQRLVTDLALRRKLGEAGRNHAASFSWDATARIVLSVLESAR
jgi:glycosyltransferase involved in cell wall biosynthesis